MPPFLFTGVITSLLLVVLAVVSRIPTYRFAPAFLIPILWGVYALRGRLRLHPFHYLLFGLALLLHNLGAFGMYQRGILGISFDHYVHFYFGIVGVLILRRLLRLAFSIHGWPVAVLALLLVMGISAIHEIIEFGSYVLLGEEKGMLKPHSSNFFDTQLDLWNNLLGAFTAVLGAAVYDRLKHREPVTHPARESRGAPPTGADAGPPGGAVQLHSGSTPR